MHNMHGRVSEWFKEPALKSGDPVIRTVGSNPTPSAIGTGDPAG